jgi:hypothetical protein
MAPYIKDTGSIKNGMEEESTLLLMEQYIMETFKIMHSLKIARK